MNAGLFLTPASVSAGDLLLVALKMPPSRTGTYSNLTPVRFSMAGIASWLRKALGLPKSSRNCGFWLTAVSPDFLDDCGSTGARRSHDGHHTETQGTPSQFSRRTRRTSQSRQGV